MFAVSGCRKRNPFSTSLAAAVAVASAVDIHDCLYVCIDDGGCRIKMAPLPQRIVWLYKRWQPLYDIIRKTAFPRVEFRRRNPMDLDGDDFFYPRITSLAAAVAVASAVDIHDCLYVCIDDGGDGGGGYT
jgi:hypothetical protein